MTNKELIKILQKSVMENGELPVEIELDYLDSEKPPYHIEEVLYDKNSVTLYNY